MKIVTANDPNIRWAKTTISMTFMSWAYSVTHEATVRGNCSAMDNLDAALNTVYDALPVDGYGVPYLTLTDASGEILEDGDEDDRQTEWLMRLLVSAHVVRIEEVKP